MRKVPHTNEEMRAFRAASMDEAITAYGGACVCCGEVHRPFLTLDHVNNDGNTHSKEIGGKGYRLARWAKNNGWPPALQVRCWNCNCAKGRCPSTHKAATNTATKEATV